MTIEYGDQSYYVSAKVRLLLRFEEFGTTVLKDKAPKKSIPKLKGVKDLRAPLEVKLEEVPEGSGQFQYVLTSRIPSTKGSGTEQKKSSDVLTHEILGVIPKKASWKLNSIREADTLSVTLRKEDLPIDPRVVRSCAIEFYLGTVTDTEFAEGIAGVTRGDVFGSGTPNAKERMNIVADSYRDKHGKTRTNLRFQGWVDKWKLTEGEDEAIIELECVDNTRLIEKQVRPAKLTMGMDKPIDEAFADYLSHFPQMEGLSVTYLPRAYSKTEIPTLKGALAKTAFVPELGPPGGNAGTAGGSTENVLDYLTTCAMSIGHSIWFEGTTLIIQRASNLMNTGPIPRSNDPYQGRKLKSGDYPVRAFIYGKNVLAYTVERDYAKHAPKNIEVRSYDPHRKNVLVARFPEKDDQLVNSGPGDGKADKDWTVVQVAEGIRDKAFLKSIAEEIYNSVGRQELLINVKTKNLSSFGGDNLDTDLLDMKVGDAFELLANRSMDDGTSSDAERKLSSFDLNQQMLVDMGFEREFAVAYAKAYTDAGFQREYKLREMTVDWSTDEGIAFDITGMNYIVARVDRPTSAGTER